MDREVTLDKATPHAKFLENAKKVLNPENTREDLVTYYDQWSSHYDKQQDGELNAPILCAEMMLRHGGEAKDKAILDVGAGTGFVGEQLRSGGFTNIDGLEPSKGMLEKAEDKKVYGRLFQCFFTDSVECLKTNSYDGIVSSGTFGGPQVQPSALKEVVRVVKPGGYVCIVTRSAYLSPDSPMWQEMERLEKEEKLWVLIEKRLCPKYLRNVEGTGVIFKITKD